MNVEDTASCFKRGQVKRSINGVGRRHSNKKHDFSDQKDTDSERVGFVLLLDVLELIGQRGVSGMRFRQGRPPVSNSHSTLRSPLESAQNCPLGEVKASA